MKKKLLALCLSMGLLAGVPAISFAEVNIVPQDLSAAPNIATTALQQLSWIPVNPAEKSIIDLAQQGQSLNFANISGPVAAYSVPANMGELTINLNSEINRHQVYSPNVLVFDQNMTPFAYFPSQYFTYQEASVMEGDSLSGTIKLTPALGQKQLYLLVFTTPDDLKNTTTQIDPAKAYAKGVGNAVPDIPDPIAKHVTQGKLKLNVASNSNSSVLIGALFGSPKVAPVTVGDTASTSVAVATPPVKQAEILSGTEDYFNQAIKKSIDNGDIDSALKLLDEAERLGSKSARKTFIENVKKP
ncbi:MULTISPECIES: maltose operon protein MalM [Enterobacterales]|jgi:maltose operon protein|uniref:Maltose regulon periplasmic protein n=4 Tax=Morganellaceae TaxID=1903414 RepID=A0A899NGS3_PROST|nr:MULTISPECIES: maltose operon protein MalM [Morganellaceae]QHP74604.1 maltose operon protein MalM [Proteus vulgaris]EKH6498570.1 maltose operon protein MalM [Providencia rettgeri]ELB1111397.1 maltose operon protein MalM [Morganella morganii]ELL8907243.1 maltose operon protein MalM [Proteus mirabilis]ELL8909145.1 maltose operon protein MalM [Proteus mirabilis]